MKQEVYKPKFLFVSRFLSRFINPFWRLFSHHSYNVPLPFSTINTVIVFEYHCIGDVILVSSMLKGIKEKLPSAKLVLITSPATANLAHFTNLSDEVIPFSAPWVKGLLSWHHWKETWSLIGRLRNIAFDLGVDFKGDIRNLFFMYFVKPRYRLGYTATGGKFLLTHPQSFPFSEHQVERAAHLLNSCGIPVDRLAPHIPMGSSSIKDQDQEYSIVLHPGANHPDRLWPQSHWMDLINLFGERVTISIIETADTTRIVQQVVHTFPTVRIFKGSLLEFYRWLHNKSLLIGVDSMAVHLATALGIPALAIFGSQNPGLTRPYGINGFFVKPKKPCAHKRFDWRLCRQCMAAVTPEEVFSKTIDILDIQR